MPKQTTESTIESSVTWKHPEAWVRRKMREWVQELLDAEVGGLTRNEPVVMFDGGLGAAGGR